jgi:methylated-DNA-[protein]-cysteine S-methyltransferase
MFYDYFETGLIGTLTLVGDEEGLRRVVFPEEKIQLIIQSRWNRKPEFFAAVKAQLRAYFKGELKEFDLPLAPMGNPKAARAVGAANGRNPLPIIVPCHRCIGSDGSLTGFGGGLDTKKRLIDLERSRL